MNATLSPYYTDINNGNPQHCQIFATDLNGNTLTLTDDNIRQGGFQYDARSTSGETLEIGSAITAQLVLTVNADADVDSFAWYGATIIAQVGVESGGAIVYGNIGVFIVDEADRRYDVWTITALDNLVRFDRVLKSTEWDTINNGEYTLLGLIRLACGVCGVTLGTHSDLLFYGASIPTLKANTSTTWRNIIQYCAEYGGTVAYCDENGQLCFGWYDISSTANASNTISYDKRYKSNVALDDVNFTGVVVTVTDDEGNDVVYQSPLSGAGDYYINIVDNPLYTTSNMSSVALIKNRLLDTNPYRPFEAQTVPYFYLQPLDACFVTTDNVNKRSVVTHISYTLNGSCTVEAVGKSVQTKSYQQGSAFTRAQAVAIDNVREQVTNYVNEREKAVKNLNILMANALGLQTYTDRNTGVWYAYYAPNNDGIDNATIVYTLNNRGFAWTTSFDSAHPEQAVWTYGVDKNGNAILAQLNVTGITVADDNTTFATEITPDGWSLKNYGIPLMTASVATGEGVLTLQKTVIGESGYIKIGKARLYGTTNGMDIVVED